MSELGARTGRGEAEVSKDRCQNRRREQGQAGRQTPRWAIKSSKSEMSPEEGSLGWRWRSTVWRSTGWRSAVWRSAGWRSTGWISTGWRSAGWRSAGWRSAGWRSAGWRPAGWRSAGWRSTGWRSSGWRSVRWRSIGWRSTGHCVAIAQLEKMSELAETGRVKGLVRVWLLEWISMSYRSFYLIWRLLRSGVTLHLRETGVQEWFGSGEQAGGEEVAEATMHGALASKSGGWVRVSASLLFTAPEGRDADSKPQERLTLWPETKQQGSNCMLHVQNIIFKATYSSYCAFFFVMAPPCNMGACQMRAAKAGGFCKVSHGKGWCALTYLHCVGMPLSNEVWRWQATHHGGRRFCCGALLAFFTWQSGAWVCLAACVSWFPCSQCSITFFAVPLLHDYFMECNQPFLFLDISFIWHMLVGVL